MTFFSLMQALKTSTPITLQSCGVIHRHVQVTGIQSEDGSGKCWNVTIIGRVGPKKIVFVRTID